MAHKQSAKRTPSKKPVSKKLPPPSSPPSSLNEDQQQHHESPSPPPSPSPSPKRSKSEKKKKENGNDNDTEIEEKKGRSSPLRMIWKVEDETAMLKGMAAFKASTHDDPYKNAEAFRDFMKESEYSLPEASIVQLKDKIRKMKSKFAHGVGGHEFKELAKKVWEPEKNTVCEEEQEEQEQERDCNSMRRSGRSSKRVRFAESEQEEEQECDDDWKGIIGNWSEVLPGVSQEDLNKAFNSIEGSERAEWVARWKKHKIAEFELCVNKTELIRDLAKLMWGAYKSSNH